uniref:Uncharacterized protein n=1 Tax=Ditylenchus dipsaci TaxID=166011 RepID=A0A915D7R6_9BILA
MFAQVLFIVYTLFRLVNHLCFAQLQQPEEIIQIKDWYCGNDAITTAISYMVSGICPRHRLNRCCMAHDHCYERWRYSLTALYQCDDHFAYCIYAAYCAENPFCANWLFETHVKPIQLFGDDYKRNMDEFIKHT